MKHLFWREVVSNRRYRHPRKKIEMLELELTCGHAATRYASRDRNGTGELIIPKKVVCIECEEAYEESSRLTPSPDRR